MKKLHPNRIKPGMVTSAGLKGDRHVGTMNQYRLLTVESVSKRHAVFSAGFVWHVKFTNGESFSYFGKGRLLGPTYFEALEVV